MRMRTIAHNWIKTHLMKLGLVSTMLVAPAIAIPQIAVAQSPTTSESSASESATETPTEASSDLSEYSPETAPLLYEGRSGEAVEAVQSFLQRQDFYNGVIDGVYGPRTVSSIITFQRSRNLSADGIVGESTWEALLDAYNRTSPDVGEDAITEYNPETAPTLAYGIRGPAVEAVQAFLKTNNYYSGAVDGIFGASTRAAVIAFQEPYVGLEADGIVGENTWDAFIDVATAKG
ncbi:MAG: peptidoglycan-binding domain-containing protein [Elainellaceae cyanobacterium]